MSSQSLVLSLALIVALQLVSRQSFSGMKRNSGCGFCRADLAGFNLITLDEFLQDGR